MLRKQIEGEGCAALSPFFKPGKTFPDADKRGKGMEVGCLLLGFYCTSKKLIVKLHLLVKLEQHSKKDLA